MSQCRETYQGDFHLFCNLDEHDEVLSFHYDAIFNLEWRHPLTPVAVISTRTAKPDKPRAARRFNPTGSWQNVKAA
jgi:hypothetical protein